MSSVTTSSPSPTTIASMNGAIGSGLEKAHTPPISTTGSLGRRSAARSGQPGHPQEPGDVDVVALVGDREADEIEVRQGALRLERERRRARSRVLVDILGVGKEHPLAHGVGQAR